MARIPAIKRISSEDFKEQSGWIGRLLSPLNEFMSTVVNALSGSLTFRDNMLCQIKELEFTQDPTQTYPIEFQCAISTKPIGLIVVGAREVTSTPTSLTTAVWADWEWNNGVIKIFNISGLTTGRKYRITVILIGG